jgi:hypothetical protein
MSNSSFSTPWTPSLRGNHLVPCTLLAALGRPDPSSADDSRWTRKALLPELAKVPVEAREAVLESVIAIWRLKKTEEEGPDDPVWEDHLEAWLVRREIFVRCSRN